VSTGASRRRRATAGPATAVGGPRLEGSLQPVAFDALTPEALHRTGVPRFAPDGRKRMTHSKRESAGGLPRTGAAADEFGSRGREELPDGAPHAERAVRPLMPQHKSDGDRASAGRARAARD
jgi:hypothetical protein